MNMFYEEVLVSADPDRGISFNTLLMILAHYKVINDNKSLRFVLLKKLPRSVDISNQVQTGRISSSASQTSKSRRSCTKENRYRLFRHVILVVPLPQSKESQTVWQHDNRASVQRSRDSR